MKNLNTYVEELLYRHQCVIIPDFGAFISNRKAAELTQDNTFSPPQKELTFNSRLTYNDGLLSKHISEVEKISYEEAQDFIKETAAQWKESLEKGEQLVFENLGSFTQGFNGNVVFEPSNKENYLTDSFGMSAFTPHEVNKDDQTSVAQEVTMENPIVSPAEAQAGKPKRKLPVLVKYAAVGIVALSAISYGVYAFLNNQTPENAIAQQSQADPAIVQQKLEEKIRNEQAAFLENPIEFTEPATIENIKKDAKLAQKQAQEARQKAEAEAKAQAAAQAQAEKQATEKEKTEKEKTEKKQETKVATSTQASSGFHLIAGAFSSEQNAQNRIKQLKQNGHTEASIIGKNAKGLFLVAYKSFGTKAEAEAQVAELKAKGIDTWVYSAK